MTGPLHLRNGDGGAGASSLTGSARAADGPGSASGAGRVGMGEAWGRRRQAGDLEHPLRSREIRKASREPSSRSRKRPPAACLVHGCVEAKSLSTLQRLVLSPKAAQGAVSAHHVRVSDAGRHRDNQHVGRLSDTLACAACHPVPAASASTVMRARRWFHREPPRSSRTRGECGRSCPGSRPRPRASAGGAPTWSASGI
jgi:hypothetical protein